MTAPQTPDSHPAVATTRPFATAPDPSRYFPAVAMEEARQRIGRSIQRGEGPVLVIGAAGLGKTMLLQVVAQEYGEQLRPVLVAGGQLCTRRALLQAILFQLELPYREMDENELRLSLLSYLQPQSAPARRILLLVDEADALPTRLLEELRALTNVSQAGQLLVNLVLAGNSNLEEQFADPKLELFSQRISARTYLTALGREETFQYVLAQAATTGKDAHALFAQDGLEAIFAATDGVPRLVNQLGDQLLWMVAETGYEPVDGMIVQQAWSELQQLPAPWNNTTQSAGSPVEYGELDGEELVLEEELGLEVDTELDDEFQSVEADVHEVDDYDNENYADDLTDLPASIPFQASATANHAGEETEIIDLTGEGELCDVTDQVLDQLSVMDTASAESVPRYDQTENPMNNPFAEDFESEEIVLDRYSTFESLLLAEAPRVTNSADSSFSRQLQEFEAIENSKTGAAPSEEAATPESQSLAVAADSAISDESSEGPGELLVIEDNEPTVTEIVNGQKFRQLFSSLECAGN